MKRLIPTILLILPNCIAISQTRLVIGQSDSIVYEPNPYEDNLDSLALAVYDGNLLICENFEVYFDKTYKQIAYKTEQFGDTCRTTDYWRNGNLKKVCLYSTENGFPIWRHQRLYCENGQLIISAPINTSDTVLIVNYHCNGEKKMEFLSMGSRRNGKCTTWHTNGRVEIEMFFEDNNRVGSWKYWDEQGRLVKTETYENDQLIETINN